MLEVDWRMMARGALLVGMALALPACGSFGFGRDSAESEPAVQLSAAPDPVPASSGPVVRLDFDPEAECPPVKIPTGGSAFVSPAGSAGTENVRFQVSITEMARECVLEPGNQVLVKIGIRGVVTIGPKGAPGSYSAPVVFTVKDREGNVVTTEAAKVGATVGADGAPARFQFVSQSVRVPISPSKPMRSHDLLVSFQTRG